MSENMDINTLKALSKMKSVDEVDAALAGDNSIKNEFQAAKEVEELKDTVKQQQILIHAMWRMLKEHGFTNVDFNLHLKEAVQLSNRKDFKNNVDCPNCGKGMQKMEKVPFTLKCYYCGTEFLSNPFMKYDGLDPNAIEYKTERASGEELDAQSAPENYEKKVAQTEEEAIANAEAILNSSFEPYDVSQDLNFDEEQ
ncbi:MAG: hypothetical protein E7386_09385 [Ruminococcaceae bacterium]|nr:hypothetical protein [Oscillospiraceae bacterium]